MGLVLSLVWCGGVSNSLDLFMPVGTDRLSLVGMAVVQVDSDWFACSSLRLSVHSTHRC